MCSCQVFRRVLHIVCESLHFDCDGGENATVIQKNKCSELCFHLQRKTCCVHMLRDGSDRLYHLWPCTSLYAIFGFTIMSHCFFYALSFHPTLSIRSADQLPPLLDTKLVISHLSFTQQSPKSAVTARPSTLAVMR